MFSNIIYNRIKLYSYFNSNVTRITRIEHPLYQHYLHANFIFKSALKIAIGREVFIIFVFNEKYCRQNISVATETTSHSLLSKTWVSCPTTLSLSLSLYLVHSRTLFFTLPPFLSISLIQKFTWSTHCLYLSLSHHSLMFFSISRSIFFSVRKHYLTFIRYHFNSCTIKFLSFKRSYKLFYLTPL